MDRLQSADPWEYTLGMLIEMSTPVWDADDRMHLHSKAVNCIAVARRNDLASRKQVAYLHIVEKYSDAVIAVCWRDATSGRYGEQLWKRVISRTRATCALSGLQIRRGDAVFRPWARGCKPFNADLMILASALATLKEHANTSGVTFPHLSWCIAVHAPAQMSLAYNQHDGENAL